MSGTQTLVQQRFRVRTDSTAAQGGTPTWAAAENTNCSISAGTPFGLRVTIANTGTAGTASRSFSIEYSKNGGAYAAVITTGIDVKAVDRTSGASTDNSAITSSLLTAGTGTFTNGQYDSTGTAAANIMASGMYTEYEFGLQFVSGGVSNGDTFDFRVYFDGAVLDTYSVTPRVTVGGAKSLAAGAGSYAVTGSSQTISHQFRIAAAAGSYGLTGTVASVLAKKRVVAAAGTYAYSGQSAGVLAKKVISAGAASYSLTGTSAALKHALKLIAGAGSYSITGIDAALTHIAELIIAPDAGLYSITGTDITLTLAHFIEAAAGSYVLTGVDAALVKAGWALDSSGSTTWTDESSVSSTWTVDSRPSTTWTIQ